MKKHYTYVLTFEKEGCIDLYYIGYSSKMSKRRTRHFREIDNITSTNANINSALEDGYVFKHFLEMASDTRKEAYELEQELILNCSNDPGILNIALGHDTISRNPNKDDIITRREASWKKWLESLSDEERHIQFESVRGERNPMYGKTHTKEAVAKIRSKLKAYYDKNPGHSLGKIASPETRKKLSINASKRTGSKNPFYGKVHSPETRRKISESNKGRPPLNRKPVMVEGVHYSSATDAAKALGCGVPLVCFRIKSKNPKFKNWEWFKCPTTTESVADAMSVSK